MLAFLKVFIRGIVVTLLLPIILLVLVIYGVYCIFLFVFMFFKGVIEYFQGKSFSTDLPEDSEARRQLLEQELTEQRAKEMLNVMYQNHMAQQQFINQQPQKEDEIEYLKPKQEPEQSSLIEPQGETPDDNGGN